MCRTNNGLKTVPMNAGAYRLVLTKLIHSPTDLFIEILRNFCRVSSNIVEFETRLKFAKNLLPKGCKDFKVFYILKSEPSKFWHSKILSTAT